MRHAKLAGQAMFDGVPVFRVCTERVVLDVALRQPPQLLTWPSKDVSGPALWWCRVAIILRDAGGMRAPSSKVTNAIS